MKTERTTPDLRLEVRIDAPPEEVFPFVVEPELLVRWMGAAYQGGGRAGEGYRLDIKGDGTAVAVGEVVLVDPPRQVVFSWGWEGMEPVAPGSTTVTIDIEPDGAGTRVVLTHAGLPLGPDVEHRTGWTHYLGRLTVAAAGGDPGPDPVAAS